MKFKLASTISALALISTATLATVPALMNAANNVTNQTDSAKESTITNGIAHSDNVQVLNSVDEIVISDYKISDGTVGSAIITNNGKQEIYVWGYNNDGQLGLSHTNNVLVPTLLPASKLGNYTSIIQLTMSRYACSAIVQTDVGMQIYVWGQNTKGELGIGDFNNRSVPTLFDTAQFGEYTLIKKFIITTEVMARFIDGSNSLLSPHIILLTKSGREKIYVWGRNDFGQLGLGSTTNIHTPTLFDLSQFGAFESIKSFSLYPSAYIVLKTNGQDKIYVWGYNVSGQLGIGHTTNLSVPTEFIHADFAGSIIKEFVLTPHISSYMILTVNNIDKLYTWGYNNDGQLGINSTTNRNTPALIPASAFNNSSEIIEVHFNWGSVTAIVRSNGVNVIYVWGYNAYGQLGMGSTSNLLVPTLFSNSRIGDAIEIYDSSFTRDNTSEFSYAYVKTLTGDRLYVWGRNDHGQLGISNTTSQTSPYRSTTFDLDKVKIINFNNGALLHNSFATIKKDNKLEYYATGFNTSGQIGINTVANVSTFTQILPTRFTSPKAILKNQTLTANDALDKINPNGVLNQTELAKYVDLTSFPTNSALSINKATTTVDYEQGIINLAIKTNRYDGLLIKDTIVADKEFEVQITGFTPAKDINVHPVTVRNNPNNKLNAEQFFSKVVNDKYEVIDKALLAEYLDLSGIPLTSNDVKLYLYRNSFDSNDKASFTLTSNQVFVDGGRSTLMDYKTIVEISFQQLNLSLIISLSVIGGLGLIGAIVAIIITKKKSSRLVL